MTWKRIECFVEREILGLEQESSPKNTEVLSSLSGVFQVKGGYDSVALKTLMDKLQPQMRIETNYVERSWICSPRGRVSVIAGKVIFDGYLKSFRSRVTEDDSPEAVITVATDNTK